MDLVSIGENEITIKMFSSEAAKLAAALIQDGDVDKPGHFSMGESDVWIAFLAAAAVAAEAVHPRLDGQIFLDRFRCGCIGCPCDEHATEERD